MIGASIVFSFGFLRPLIPSEKNLCILFRCSLRRSFAYAIIRAAVQGRKGDFHIWRPHVVYIPWSKQGMELKNPQFCTFPLKGDTCGRGKAFAGIKDVVQVINWAVYSLYCSYSKGPPVNKCFIKAFHMSPCVYEMRTKESK